MRQAGTMTAVSRGGLEFSSFMTNSWFDEGFENRWTFAQSFLSQADSIISNSTERLCLAQTWRAVVLCSLFLIWSCRARASSCGSCSPSVNTRIGPRRQFWSGLLLPRCTQWLCFRKRKSLTCKLSGTSHLFMSCGLRFSPWRRLHIRFSRGYLFLFMFPYLPGRIGLFATWPLDRKKLASSWGLNSNELGPKYNLTFGNSSASTRPLTICRSFLQLLANHCTGTPQVCTAFFCREPLAIHLGLVHEVSYHDCNHDLRWHEVSNVNLTLQVIIVVCRTSWLGQGLGKTILCSCST